MRSREGFLISDDALPRIFILPPIPTGAEFMGGLGGAPQVVHPRPPFIAIILLLFHYNLGKVHLNSFYRLSLSNLHGKER